MDPITLWIFFLATGWIIRSLAEDVIAAIAHARGRPYTSPRIVRREARQRLAEERIAAGGSPPLTIVFSQWVAQRVANPPERRWLNEARAYLDLRIADGFEDARIRHEQRRAERLRQAHPDPASDHTRHDSTVPDDTVDDSIVDAEIVEPQPGSWWVSTVPKCPTCGKPMIRDDGRDDREHADGTVTVPLKCYGCDTVSEHTVPDPMPRACRACSVPGVPLTSDGLCSACYAAGKANDEPADPAPPPPPPPTPALPASAVITRKDSPVSQPHTINGDVGSPREALAYCEETLGLNQACRNEIEIATNQLRGAGVGDTFLQIVGAAYAATDTFNSVVAGGRVRYARHVMHQADLASDPDLRSTLVGYLSADKA